MTCHECRPHLSSLLDGEVSAADEALLRSHLAECGECRSALEELRLVDRWLSDRLPGPDPDLLLRRIEQSVSVPAPLLPSPAAPPRPSRRQSWGVVALAAGLLVALGSLLRSPATNLPTLPPAAPVEVASVTYAVGRVEIRRPGDPQWNAVPVGTRTELAEGSRIRTPLDCLCELQTSCQGTLRLNEQTEIVVHVQERVELVRGKLWAQAARQCDLDIQLPPTSAVEPRAPLAPFVCPSSSEMQWNVEPSLATCLALTSPAVAMTHRDVPISIDKGQAVAVVDGRADEVAFRADPLAATSWQMPLLLQKSPDDSELQSRLDAMLAVIGETKASYLYEQQIRELGPAGTIPLLAYVRSPGSRANPERRRRAMSLALSLLSSDQIDRVAPLLMDSDPVIREQAEAAIKHRGPAGQKL